jgi:hypothetical protein
LLPPPPARGKGSRAERAVQVAELPVSPCITKYSEPFPRRRFTAQEAVRSFLQGAALHARHHIGRWAQGQVRHRDALDVRVYY